MWSIAHILVFIATFNGIHAVPPVITTPPEDATVVEGAAIRIKCYSADSADSLSWSFNGVTLSANGIIIIQPRKLNIMTVDTTHQGTYQCTARNANGEQVSAEMYLTVKVTCTTPTAPANGTVSTYRDENQDLFAVFKCDGGFHPVGEHYTRMCHQNRTWSGESPNCTYFMDIHKLDADELTGKINEVHNSTQMLMGYISQLRASVNTSIDNIHSIESVNQAYSSSITTLEANLNTALTSLNDIPALGSRLDVFENDINDLSISLISMNNTLNTITEENQVLQSTVASQQSTIDTQQATILDSAAVTDMNSTLNALRIRTEGLETTYQTQQTTINAQQATINTQQATIGGLQTTIQNLENTSELDEITQAIAELSTSAGTGSSDLEALQLQVNTLDNTMQTALLYLNGNVTNHTTRIEWLETERYEMSLSDEWQGTLTAKSIRNGEGTVCHNGWGDDDCKVVCTQLGYGGGWDKRTYDSGSGQIVLANVDCEGTESHLAVCPHIWGVTDASCDHSMDAGCTCQMPADREIEYLTNQLQLLENDMLFYSSSRKVAFTACATYTTWYSHNEVAQFAHELLDYNDNYNPSTGIFTCPYHGIYEFDVTVLNNQGSYVRAQIVTSSNRQLGTVKVNDDGLYSFQLPDECTWWVVGCWHWVSGAWISDDYNTQSSQSVIMECAEGEEVWLSITDYSGIFGTSGSDPDSRCISSFSGNLISVFHTMESASELDTSVVSSNMVKFYEFLEGLKNDLHSLASDDVTAFMACTTTNVMYSGGDEVAFPSVLYNHGNQYTNNGRFLCPHNGLYEFTLTAASYDAGEVKAVITKNGIINIAEVYIAAGTGYDRQASTSITMECGEGDEVYVTSEVNSYIYGASGVCQTVFTGKLITVLDNNSTVAGTARAGRLTSDNYPSNYPNNADTSEVTTVDEGKRIKLFFNMIDIEDDADCRYDYLTIYDGPTTDFRKLIYLCGTITLEPIVSSGHQVLLVFHSDGSVQFSGYEILYEQISALPAQRVCANAPESGRILCSGIDRTIVTSEEECYAIAPYCCWDNTVAAEPSCYQVDRNCPTTPPTFGRSQCQTANSATTESQCFELSEACCWNELDGEPSCYEVSTLSCRSEWQLFTDAYPAVSNDLRHHSATSIEDCKWHCIDYGTSCYGFTFNTDSISCVLNLHVSSLTEQLTTDAEHTNQYYRRNVICPEEASIIAELGFDVSTLTSDMLGLLKRAQQLKTETTFYKDSMASLFTACHQGWGDTAFFSGNVLTFTHVVYNPRKLFNAETSEFICPYNGIYEFSLTISSMSNGNLAARIAKVTPWTYFTLGEAWTQDQDAYTQTSITTIIDCNYGERVRVEIADKPWRYYDSSPSTAQYVAGKNAGDTMCHTMFSGRQIARIDRYNIV